jgi:hypothetical protein
MIFVCKIKQVCNTNQNNQGIILINLNYCPVNFEKIPVE